MIIYTNRNTWGCGKKFWASAAKQPWYAADLNPGSQNLLDDLGLVAISRPDLPPRVGMRIKRVDKNAINCKLNIWTLRGRQTIYPSSSEFSVLTDNGSSEFHESH